MFKKFANDFWWEATSSCLRHEGGRGLSIWDKYYEMHSYCFFNEVEPQECRDFYHRFIKKT